MCCGLNQCIKLLSDVSSRTPVSPFSAASFSFKAATSAGMPPQGPYALTIGSLRASAALCMAASGGAQYTTPASPVHMTVSWLQYKPRRCALILTHSAGLFYTRMDTEPRCSGGCRTGAACTVFEGRCNAPCASDKTPSTPAISAFVLPMTGSSVSSTRSDTCRSRKAVAPEPLATDAGLEVQAAKA